MFVAAMCYAAATFAATTIYLSPNSTWREASAKTAIYYFNSADAGNQNGWTDYMEIADETGVLKADIEDGFDMIIFVRFAPDRAAEISWDSNWGQTIDIALESGKNLYTIKSDARDEGKWKDGEWSAYVAPVKETITYQVKVPVGTEKVFMAGNWDGTGNWTFAEMEKDGENQFKKVVENQLKSFEYKYYAAEDWAYEELDANGLRIENRTYQDAIDEVAMFGDPSVIRWFVAGSFNEWKPASLEGSDYTALTFSVVLEANKDHNFKLVRMKGASMSWFGLKGWSAIEESVEGWLVFEDGADNVGLKTKDAGKYSLTVDVTNMDGEALAPKFSLKFPEATGIDHVVGNAASLKVMENGVLYIYRNGVKYDVQGKAVR